MQQGTMARGSAATEINNNIIGLLPAAGRASRVSPLPGSKELFPVGFGPMAGKQGLRPKVASHYLLEQMRLAGARKAFIILRSGKWDIPTYFGDGHLQDMHLAYLIMRHPFGVPYTLDQAYPFVQSATIVFGFPDIVFFPKNAYVHLLAHMTAHDADVTLGVFNAQRPEKMDMVELDEADGVRRIDIKPRATHLTHTWIAAVWKPAFTQFMHEFVARDAENRAQSDAARDGPNRELHLGEAIQAAIDHEMNVSMVRFDSGRYLDIGTPEDIVAAANFVNNAFL
jgi:glucose-1-phosphate thymidylyltransferase